MKATFDLPLPVVALARGHGARRWLVLIRRAVRGSDAALGRSWLVCGLAALVVFFVFAITEHRAQKAVVQQAETQRLMGDFTSPPVASSWHRLSTVWQSVLPRQEALLVRAQAQASDPVAALRPWRRFMLEVVEEEGLQRDIETVLAFFRRLALCVRMGNCDADVLRERFGDLPWRFRNQHHPYLVESRPGEDFDRYFEIVSPRAG